MSFFSANYLALRFASRLTPLPVRLPSDLLNALYAVFKVLLVGSSGLEPPTSRLSGVRSNQLSYEPIQSDPAASPHWKPQLVSCASFAQLEKLVEMNGIEPMTPCLQSRCSPS